MKTFNLSLCLSLLVGTLFSFQVFAQDGNPEPNKKSDIPESVKQIDTKAMNVDVELGDKAKNAGAGAKSAGIQMTDAQLKAESAKEEPTKKLQVALSIFLTKKK